MFTESIQNCVHDGEIHYSISRETKRRIWMICDQCGAATVAFQRNWIMIQLQVER